MGSAYEPLFEPESQEGFNKHPVGYRFVSFVKRDGEVEVDKLLYQSFDHLGYLPDNIPLSDIFVSDSLRFVATMAEDIAQDMGNYDVVVANKPPIRPKLRAYYPLNDSFSLWAIDKCIKQSLYPDGLDKQHPAVKKIYAPRHDLLKISSCVEYFPGDVVKVNNFSVVQLASDNECSRATIIETFDAKKPV